MTRTPLGPRTLSILSVLALTSAAFASGCSAGDPTSGDGGSGDSNVDANGNLIDDSGNGNGNGNDDDEIVIVDGTDPVATDDKRDLDVREQVCDANGNCTCLRMALLGTLDSAANDKDAQPFVDWLNNSSDGTATVTTVSTKPTIDEAFLAQYDILLVANVNGWVFSDAEKAAVANWSKAVGGGIVSLTGFISKDAEEVATSQLIAFSGISYASAPAATTGQPPSIQYNGRDVPMYCIGDALITTPVNFTPITGMEGLSHELSYVGAYRGYSVTVPTDGAVIATDPDTGLTIAAAKEVDGAGRVFAWGDEWAIFGNQWVSTPVGQADQYNACYEPAQGAVGDADYKEPFLHTVASLYQVKQFWYNIINWVAPPSECGFVIDDPDVVVIEEE